MTANPQQIQCGLNPDRTALAKSGVAVEKLLTPKFAKIRLRQDALQSIFSGHPKFSIPQILLL
jgi:hypothetical protein